MYRRANADADDFFVSEIDGVPKKVQAAFVTAEPTLNCRFFRTEQGNEPVREWLRALSAEAKKEIGSDIQRVQWQWPVSKPLVDGLGGGLYEVRTKIDRMQYRVLFCIVDDTMVLLHGFVKKSRTEPDEIAFGRSRQKQVAQESKS